MTLFEYLAVSFSIVLSFAVVRILNGIADVFAWPRVYWIHAAWVTHKLIFLAYVWWNIWSFREISWNFLAFLAVLTNPSILYFQSSTLVPAQSGSVASWRDHFYAVRQRFFGAEIAWSLLVLLYGYLLLGVPVFHSIRITQAIGFLVAIVGMSTNRHAVHGILASVTLLAWLLRIALMFQPGSITPR